jgi:hypothetical protein
MNTVLDINTILDFFTGNIVQEPQKFFAIAVVVVVSTSDVAVSFSGWRAYYKISKVSHKGSRRYHQPILKSRIPAKTNYGNDEHIKSATWKVSVTAMTSERSSAFASNLQRARKIRFFNMELQTRSSSATATWQIHTLTVVRSAYESLSPRIVHPWPMTFNPLRLGTSRRQDVFFNVCLDDSNHALQGPRIASDFKRLQFLFPSNSPLNSFVFWPVFTFDLIAAKVNAYNQLLLSDLVSHVAWMV